MSYKEKLVFAVLDWRVPSLIMLHISTVDYNKTLWEGWNTVIVVFEKNEDARYLMKENGVDEFYGRHLCLDTNEPQCNT